MVLMHGIVVLRRITKTTFPGYPLTPRECGVTSSSLTFSGQLPLRDAAAIAAPKATASSGSTKRLLAVEEISEHLLHARDLGQAADEDNVIDVRLLRWKDCIKNGLFVFPYCCAVLFSLKN